MKRIALLALSAAGLCLGAQARADHLEIQGSFGYGAPAYVAPAGYWRDVTENVWIPPHWEMRTDFWGRSYNVWAPGHYEVRTRRVWVSAYRGDSWRWNQQHEWREHERREHEWREHEWREHDRDDHREWDHDRRDRR